MSRIPESADFGRRFQMVDSIGTIEPQAREMKMRGDGTVIKASSGGSLIAGWWYGITETGSRI